MYEKVMRKGQSLVETALVLAAFMGLLLGVVDLGQMLIMRQSLLDRVRTASRWGSMHTYDPGAIRNMVLYGTTIPGGAGFAGMQAADITVSNPGCPGPACRVEIKIAGRGVQTSELMEGE